MYKLLKVLCYEMSFDKPNCKLEIKSFSEWFENRKTFHKAQQVIHKLRALFRYATIFAEFVIRFAAIHNLGGNKHLSYVRAVEKRSD